MADPWKLHGVPQVRRKLAAAEGSVTPSALDQISKQSLEPLRQQTETNARTLRQPGPTPRGGHLDQGVVTKRVEASGKKRVWWVGFHKRARKLAHLVEFGTAPHWQPRRFGGIWHPGAKASPFFRPAYDVERQRIPRRAGDMLWQLIVKSIRGRR